MSNQQPANIRRVVIIGGGISGLAAAYQLTKPCAAGTQTPEVLLLEASARVGGTIHTHRRDDFLLEGGPDSFISEKPEAVRLAEELGLSAQLIETNDAHRRSFIVRAGRLRPVPEGFQLLAPARFWPFVTSDIFSWAGKCRVALEAFVPTRPTANGDGNDDDESLADFVRRRFGREALERMAQPMVGGIYTADPERLSLRATMPRFLDMERAHGSVIRALVNARRRAGGTANARGTSGARYSLFLTFAEGMQTLSDALARHLRTRADVRLDSSVKALHFDHEHKQWRLTLEDEETLMADAVCLALPAYRAAELLRDTDDKLADELIAIPYASTATVNLAFRRADIAHRLDGFGFVVPFVEKLTTLACTFSSVKFAGRAPEGHALLRAFVGGALQPETFALDDDEMIKRVRDDLRLLLGINAAPLFALVEKWPRSMAQYHLGHNARVARLRARLAQLPALQLAGNAYGGAGVPDCIRSGTAAADALLARLT